MATARGRGTSCGRARKARRPQRQGKARLRKEENRTKREQKAKVRKEKAMIRAKKKKEQEEVLRKRGERLTRNQPKIVEWFRKEEPGSRNAHAGGKTGVG